MMDTQGGAQIQSRAVFLDLDGTLILWGGAGPFDDDVEGIMKARKNGHRFLLCTGRGFGGIPPFIRELNWLDGFVCGGGGHVIICGKTIYQKTLDIRTLCEISGIFLSAGKQCAFQSDEATFGINGGFVIPRPGLIPIRGKNDFAEKYPDARVSMMVIDKTSGPEAEAFVKKYCNLYPQIHHTDAFIKGENKAKGMAIALKALGLARENSVGMGDSANDLEMINYAGTGIALGNASDDLKAAADWISAPCGEGGIVRALEHLGMC